jgi:hypothetical protein
MLGQSDPKWGKDRRIACAEAIGASRWGQLFSARSARPEGIGSKAFSVSPTYAPESARLRWVQSYGSRQKQSPSQNNCTLGPASFARVKPKMFSKPAVGLSRFCSSRLAGPLGRTILKQSFLRRARQWQEHFASKVESVANTTALVSPAAFSFSHLSYGCHAS